MARTERLIYDWNTRHMSEVGMIVDGELKWYRTTDTQFRSFDGPRRLTGPDRQPRIGEISAFQDLKIVTFEYNGPVYIFKTNIEVPFKNTGKYIESPERPMWGAPDQETLDLMAEKRLSREIKL